MVAGILTVMVLARGKTGMTATSRVIAPALLLTCVSGVVAARCGRLSEARGRRRRTVAFVGARSFRTDQATHATSGS